LVWRQKNRHGPTTAAGHGQRSRHVNVVEIGPLFTIDLHADESLFISAAIASFAKLSRSMT
jgi:hypothetical protein